MNAILDARNASVNYGPLIALSNVSLEVRPGEVVGIVGPNGCGKTTLIRAATRVAPLAGGSIAIVGNNIESLSQKQLACLVAVVPQNATLPDNFTVLDVVMMGRTPHLGLLQSESEGDLRAVRKAMETTNISSLASRTLGELSGGERQRVVIARALAQETPLLMLDEPTAYLDIGQQGIVLELVQTACRQRGVAVLVAMHDLTLAAHYCQRLILMKNGQIVMEGTPDEVLHEGILAEVYNTPVSVFSHPRNGRPVVTPESKVKELPDVSEIIEKRGDRQR